MKPPYNKKLFESALSPLLISLSSFKLHGEGSRGADKGVSVRRM